MVAPPDRQSTGVHRRTGSMRLSMQHDENDDYDAEAMGISDGFRPLNVEVSHSRTPSQISQHHDHTLGRRTPPPRPSSTTKPRYDSFALRHDGAMGPLPSRNPTNASSSAMPMTRSSSVSTEMAFVRPESPYQGPVGPSHPYQMYPQESRVARTPSMATTSTVQVLERSYSGPLGPTHPYGMYPQNTVPEAEDPNERPVVPPVPVGFPGRHDNYQRRLGPDGEEIADIIGPDGHTEQLPPYTQYPDEAFARKTRPAVQIPLAGAGGIGLATRNPEFASQENLNSPQSRLSTRSLMSESSHQVNTAALGESEKPQLKKWQRFARKKICGVIPVWAIILVGAAFILFIIILATVLAVLKQKHPPPKHHYDNDDNDGYPQSVVITTMTTTFDATPFTTLPLGIPALPTGTYQLPISTPSIAPASCLVDPTKSSTWSCSIPPNLPYQISIKGIPGTDRLSNSEITMDYGNYTLDVLPYGAQAPVISQAKVLKLVNDSKYPERGPAWFFQTPYNKLVILPEDALTPPSAKRDGQGGHGAAGFMGRKAVAQAGDKPWFCYWNGTLLEAFIYVNQTSNAGNMPLPGASSTGASPSGSYGGRPPASATTTIPSSVPTSDVESSGYTSSGPTEDPQFLPCYPKVVKLEERRVPIGDQSISPYCVQNFVNADGTYGPIMDNGQPVTIFLDETEPSVITPMAEKRTYEHYGARDTELVDRQSESMCGCVWLEQ